MSSVVLRVIYGTLGKVVRPKLWAKHVGRSFIPDATVTTGSNHNLDKQDFSPLGDLVSSAKTQQKSTILIDGEGVHSAGTIYSNALRLAYALKYKCNVQPGESVAILTMSEREMFESFYAIQMIGAVPVPINFVNKPKTIAFMFVDSGVKTAIFGRDKRFKQGAKNLASAGIINNAILIGKDSNKGINRCFYDYNDLISPTQPSLNEEEIVLNPSPNSSGLILYTSGTGAAPRGIRYSHMAITDAVKRCTKRFNITSKDIMAFPVPFYHLAGFIAWVGAREAKAKLLLTPLPRPKEPETIKLTYQSLKENKATILPGSPYIIEPMLELAQNEGCLLKDLRLIFSGGAPVTKNLIRLVRGLNEKRAAAAVEPIVLENFYACTELGPISSTIGGMNVNSDENSDTRRDLGKPFEDVTLSRDERGLLLAKTTFQPPGYMNRPDLSLITPSGYVRIGDIVHVIGANGDQRLLYFGRDRGSYNIRGNETSPENTQVELDKIPLIDNACVFGIVDEETEGHVLCALIVPKSGSELTAEMVDEFLSRNGVPSRNRPSIYFFESTTPQDCVNGSSKVSPTLAIEQYTSEANRIIRNNPEITIGTKIGSRVNYLISSQTTETSNIAGTYAYPPPETILEPLKTERPDESLLR